ncbi:LysR family transcriptional regulator [Klebsiella pneumoniae]|uniref:LysR family transcriptional regulator n=1 Tax=Klebsiella pneumoniae TaxID=573 RepID=A0A377UQE1_KLEPN|nr:LysR family transcriptional regulator [Klebsiella pneumoniae]
MTNESPYESLVADMRAGNIDFIIGRPAPGMKISRTSVAKRYSKRIC